MLKGSIFTHFTLNKIVLKIGRRIYFCFQKTPDITLLPREDIEPSITVYIRYYRHLKVTLVHTIIPFTKCVK